MKLPSLQHIDTYEIPANYYWRVGLDNKVYSWEKLQVMEPPRYTTLNIYFDGAIEEIQLPILSSSYLLWIDSRSNKYFGSSYMIGSEIAVLGSSNQLAWQWEPEEPISGFGFTVDDEERVWYATTDWATDFYIYSYHPEEGVTTYPFPKIDLVYGIAIGNEGKIYSFQLPTLGHFVVCTDRKGNILHQIGEMDLKKFNPEKKSHWPIYYPEDMFIDNQGRVWVEEMGRDRLVVLDEDLNILGYFDKKHFDLPSPRKFKRKFEYGFGVGILWVKEPRKTQEIILHAYNIIDD